MVGMDGPPPAPRYREWAPSPALRRAVKCVWSSGPPGVDAEPVLPDGCMDVIWNGVRLFVAGPDTGPVEDVHEGSFAVGVRMRPGAGHLLGCPAVTLRDARVDVLDLWPAALGVVESLADAGSIAVAALRLEAAVAARLSPEPAPDPVVERAAARWARDPATLPVASLAAATGLTDRQVHRRFVTAVGYGPKRLHRILRFQTFLARSGTGRIGLAELAAACGYSDQAHLSRETAVLAHRSPSQLAAARSSDVRFVQDRAARAR